jgi:IclR family pca regulon transcriptional regulator
MADEPGTRDDHGAYFVQSLARGLAVIRTFSSSSPELTLSEVARSCGLTRATARRFLLTLADLGYVHSDGRDFRLSPRVLELGYAYLSSLSLPEVAGSHLKNLTSEVHESSSVSVLDGDDIVYVARVPAKRIMTVNISVGTRFPAYVTSMGRVLLADLDEGKLELYLDKLDVRRLTAHTVRSKRALRLELDRVRKQGWALVDQELEEGLRSIAVPIRDASGRVVAAVNVSARAAATTVESVRRDLLPPLLATAARIEADLHNTAAGSERPDSDSSADSASARK